MGSNRYKLLVVEDDAAFRNLLVTLLESADYRVITAETCALAQTLFASYIPDLILLDLGLPADSDRVRFGSLIITCLHGGINLYSIKVGARESGAVSISDGAAGREVPYFVCSRSNSFMNPMRCSTPSTGMAL